MLVRQAMNMAAFHHKDQFRKGTGSPYFLHLARVANLVAPCGKEFATAAAYLHDILEDCPEVELEDVSRGTNEQVSSLVALLTEPPKTLPWEERKAAWTLQVCSNVHAALIALCDKLDNTLDIEDDISNGIAINSKLKRGILGILQSNALLLSALEAHEKRFFKQDITANALIDTYSGILKIKTRALYSQHEGEYVEYLLPKSNFLRIIME
jgi:(p)ppGpp synthase/HD superfamily hydrolase